MVRRSLMTSKRDGGNGRVSDSLNSACGILVAFFGAREIDGIVSVQRSFSHYLLPDIQSAALEMLSRLNVVRTGLHQSDPCSALTISALLAGCGVQPVAVTPLQFHQLDLGDAEPFPALNNALWLFRVSDRPVAVLLSRSTEGDIVQIEVATLPDAASTRFADQFLGVMQDAALRSARYRGKVVSLEPPIGKYARPTMRVRRPASVGRDAVILDDPTMARLERHAFAFDRHRDGLRTLGQSTRRTLLLYGAQGTGKTHLTRYIAANLPGRTTVLIAPDRTGGLAALLRLAQTFQPSLVILDDVDRIGGGCEKTGDSACGDRLRLLFTEMDRLEPDADILFLLTATHPRSLDRSLLPTLGRIEEAIEIPRPDARCRTRLVALFGASLTFEPGAIPDIVARTEGASVAYLKEMVRRLALAALMTDLGTRVSRRSVAVILGEATDSQTRVARGVAEFADTLSRRPELRMAVTGGRSTDL